jgi:hypothetical protein
MRFVASPETVERIREGGGLLFIWASRSRGPRLVLTTLVASLDPPANAFDFTRLEHDDFTLFLDPNINPAPEEAWVEFRGRRLPHPCAYWNGLAFVP